MSAKPHVGLHENCQPVLYHFKQHWDKRRYNSAIWKFIKIRLVILGYIRKSRRARQTNAFTLNRPCNVLANIKWRSCSPHEQTILLPYHMTLPWWRVHIGTHLAPGILQPRIVDRKWEIRRIQGEQPGLSAIAANYLLRRKYKGPVFSIPHRLQYSHMRCIDQDFHDWA